MVSMVTLFLVRASLAAAFRFEDGKMVSEPPPRKPVNETYEPIDCSRRHLLPANYTVRNLWDFGRSWEYDRYEVTDMEPENCNKYVGYFPFQRQFVHWARTPWNLPRRFDSAFLATSLRSKKCVLYVTGSQAPKYCAVQKGDKLWNETVPIIQDLCLSQLCSIAQTGQWHKWNAGYLKYFSNSKKKAWKQTTHGKSQGYEDAFREFCFEGPYGDMLGGFQDFVNHYGLNTSSGTFNKTVCGCKTEDDCRKSGRD